MLLHASTNTFKKWFAEVVEILKTVSDEPVHHWINRQNVWKKQYTAMFQKKFFLESEKQFQPVSQWDLCACFLRTISEVLGTVV